jgi:hypothetical protein
VPAEREEFSSVAGACMGLLDGVLFGLFAVFVGVGVAIPLGTNTTSGEFWFARLCFILAAADFASLAIYWLWTTDKGSLWLRLLIAALMGAIILPSTIEALRWIDGRQPPYQPSTPAPQAASTISAKHYYSIPLTLRNLFDTDFPYFSVNGDLIINGKKTGAIYHVLFNLHENSEFLAIFIPLQTEPNTFTLCRVVAAQYQQILEVAHQSVDVTSIVPGEPIAGSSVNLTFTRQIYIYHDQFLSLQQLAFLEQTFREKGLTPDFRGHDYLTLHWNEKREMTTADSPTKK